MKPSEIKRGNSPEEEFRLERKPADFPPPSSRNKVLVAGFCCCCCCWDVIGAYVGAYVGGTLGAGIYYYKLRRREKELPKYRWVFLCSIIAALFISALYIAALRWYDWVDDLEASTLRTALLGLSAGSSTYLYASFLMSLAVCAFAVNPLICTIALKRTSWRFLIVCGIFSLIGTLCGFAIGCAVLGGSFVFGWGPF